MSKPLLGHFALRSAARARRSIASDGAMRLAQFAAADWRMHCQRSERTRAAIARALLRLFEDTHTLAGA